MAIYQTNYLGQIIGQIANNFRGVNLNPYLTLVVYFNIIQRQPIDQTLMTLTSKQIGCNTPKIKILLKALKK